MVEAGQHAGFPVELLLGLVFHAGGAGQVGQHFLDRADAAAQAAVGRLVDRTHAALADQFDDVVALTQDGANR